MVNWVLFCSFIFSLILTLLGVVVDLTYNLKFEPRVESLHAKQSRELEVFIQEQNYFKANPIFNYQASSNDNLFEHYSQLLESRRLDSLVRADYKKQIMALGSRWIEQRNKIKLSPPVIHFFNQVSKHHHWKVDQIDPPQASSDLVVASQIFLAYHFHFQTENLRKALLTTRHLAMILLDSENLSYKRVALSLLEKEHDVINQLKARIRHAPLLWTPVSKQDMRRYRQALQRMADFLSPISDSDILQEVFLKGEPPLGFCAVFKDKVEQIAWSQNMLNNSFPFEPSFKSSVAKINLISERAKDICHPWQQPQVKESKWVARLPYVRRLYALKMIFNARQVNEFL